MSILIDDGSRVLVQGITGREGQFHTERMIRYGTRVVGGVTPGRGGQPTLGVPVFDSVRQAVRETGADVSVAFVPAALAAEAAAIRERLPKGGAVIALCIEGKPCSSVELSRRMEELAVAGKTQLTFLIGGSVGLDESLKRQADWRLSMSPMTFPHHLARIMLLEQIYRAYQISAGTKYHK